MLILMSTWTVLKDLIKKNYLLENISLVQQKKEKLVMMVKSDGHISYKDYLTCEKIWDKFYLKNMGDYYDHYLKKDVWLLADVFEKFIDTCLNFMDLILVIILVLLVYLLENISLVQQKKEKLWVIITIIT